jgi:predicted N-acetyltransferase YhbS
VTDRIRDARASDRAAIEAVTLSAYEQYGVVMPPALWVRYRENIVATLAAAPSGTQIVAEEDGSIVGSVLLYPAGGTLVPPGGGSVTLALPEVRLLAVAPSARGQGIGNLLMDECVRRARESGAAALVALGKALDPRLGNLGNHSRQLRLSSDDVDRGRQLLAGKPAEWRESEESRLT